jgi:hypothetical protein
MSDIVKSCPGCESENAPHLTNCTKQPAPVKHSFDPSSNQQAMWPAIPTYLSKPVVFRDAQLGVAMAAQWNGEQWIFRVHNGHWCSVRKVDVFDPSLIEPLNRTEVERDGR